MKVKAEAILEGGGRGLPEAPENWTSVRAGKSRVGHLSQLAIALAFRLTSNGPGPEPGAAVFTHQPDTSRVAP